MLAAATRSGIEETAHDGAVAVIGANGELIAWSGEIDRPFYLRSAAKPFQASVAQSEGALLGPIELALASASHDGDPVHIAVVNEMLIDGGLSARDLQCPASWPLGVAARHRLLRERHVSPRPIWHNCSGKHAGWLRACRTRGWDTATYLEPEHPLQTSIADRVSDLGGYDVRPVGVDGCGAPVLRTTVRAMARLYWHLGSSEHLGDVFSVMHRYPGLVSGSARGDGAIPLALNAAAKGGAAGCLGIALEGGCGIAVKSWDGSGAVAEVAAIATLLEMGLLVEASEAQLKPWAHPSIMGGDRVVGRLEPRVKLRFS